MSGSNMAQPQMLRAEPNDEEQASADLVRTLCIRGSDEYLMAFSQVLTADQAQAVFNRGQGYIHALKVAGIVCDQEAADMEYLLRAKASQHAWNLTDA